MILNTWPERRGSASSLQGPSFSQTRLIVFSPGLGSSVLLLPSPIDCLSQGVKVKESTVFTRKYCTELTNLSTLSVFEVEIWCYRGGDTIPPWILRHHGIF